MRPIQRTRRPGVTVSDRTRLEPGTQLRVRRSLGYFHHGVAVGDDQVVQFGGRVSDKPRANVEIVPLERFASGGRVESVDVTALSKRAGRRRVASADATERALWLARRHPLGRYNLLGRNCETVANWCTTGIPVSYQYYGKYLAYALVVTITFFCRETRVVRMLPPWVYRSAGLLFWIRVAASLTAGWTSFRFTRFVEHYPSPSDPSVIRDFFAFLDELSEIAAARDIGGSRGSADLTSSPGFSKRGSR